MTKNFKVRLGVSLILLVLAAVFLFTFDSLPFKIFFIFFAFISSIELFSFFSKKSNFLNAFLAIFEIIFLIFGAIFTFKASLPEIILYIFGICGYDVFAYLFGNLCGGKIFKKSRPFPFVSKNKTWEGTVLGLASSILLVFLIQKAIFAINPEITFNLLSANFFYLCAPLALVGDLFESLLKRTFSVKDSNEIVIKNPFFAKLELLVGGSEGHGGYLDRIDSIAFTTAVLFLISILV